MADRTAFLLETDQIHCYDEDGQPIACEGTGQDASHAKSNLLHPERRFQVDDHTVKDELNGAVWSRNANPAEFPLTWNEALAYAAKMCARNAHGYNVWRLPTRNLLFSLVSHQHVNPALPASHPFENIFTGYYWTEDSCFRLPDQAWYVHLGGGRVHRGMKHGSYMVWPVSLDNLKATAPVRNQKNRFIAGDTSVNDVRTGLIWSKDANPAGRPLSWQEALSMVQTYNRRKLGGRHDWRLPNIRELESLVDLGAHSPALPTDHPFVNVQDSYWSSTTSVYETRYAWTLYSRDGIVGVGFKPGDDFFLWPVCNG